MPKTLNRPIILGIVGDSATGKTTLSSGVAKILSEERCTTICTDDYHRYSRSERHELGISALDPRANYVDILEQHLQLLRRGGKLLKLVPAPRIKPCLFNRLLLCLQLRVQPPEKFPAQTADGGGAARGDARFRYRCADGHRQIQELQGLLELSFDEPKTPTKAKKG